MSSLPPHSSPLVTDVTGYLWSLVCLLWADLALRVLLAGAGVLSSQQGAAQAVSPEEWMSPLNVFLRQGSNQTEAGLRVEL